MNDLEKQALEAVARAMLDIRLPRVESDQAHNIRMMINARRIRLATEIEEAIARGDA
jgi:hypothetical protein